MRRLIVVVSMIVTAALYGMAIAGSVDSPGAPSVGSGMYTLQNLYDYLMSGTELTVRSGFQEPLSGPTASTMKSTRQIGDDIKAMLEQLNATTAYDVALGKPFFCTQPGSWGIQTGKVCIAGTPTPTPTITPTVTPTLTPTPVWLSGWGYRKPITLSNSGSALTDYQVLLTMNTEELIPAKMRSDGGDIRFTDSDEITLINCWIKSGINTASTKIWVKVPSVPAGSKMIYVYYGNSGAGSVSDSSKFLNSGLRWYHNGEDTDNKVITDYGNITLTGTASAGTGAGIVGHGFAVDGSSNQFKINSAFASGETQFTMNWWVKSSQNETNYFRTGVSEPVGSGTYCYYHEGNARGHYCVVGGLSNPLNTSTNEDTVNYHMITIRQDATTEYLFVNGSQVDTETQTGEMGQAGSFPNLFSKDLSGGLDEIGYWNRSLTNQEISQLYNNGNGRAVFAIPAPTASVGTEEM
ncbi:MAG: DUF2341 domain-containing protein [Candidatus Aureabacteria bacterium]|nr:DUF2341 domain-containing protein [Candidatus Auribacterota bacterium]